MKPHRDIKKFLPRAGRFQQGVVNPEECNRLFESQKHKPIIYRSSWEKAFIVWCETSSIVRRWGSECFPIKYISAVDNSEHLYYPDYIIEDTNGQVYIIEIKPYNQTVKPNPQKCSRYQWETWLKNASKWTAAKKKCEQNGVKFKIITEKTLAKMNLL